MALWDSAALLAASKRFARRPAVDESYADADWYASLTNGQAVAIADLAARAPDSLYGAPALLVSGDSGKTYNLPNDADSEARFSLGHAQIYENLEAIPDHPLIPGVDFIAEARQIRILNNTTRTFSAGPYARYVLEGGTINASNEPTIYPKAARMMLVYWAVGEWAARPGSGADPTYWTKMYEQAFSRWLTTMRTQYNMAAAQMPNAVNLSRRSGVRFLLGGRR